VAEEPARGGGDFSADASGNSRAANEAEAAGMSVAAAPIQNPSNPAQVARSRRYCAELTRAAARNFYYGLKLLPEPKRSAMFALYAYMRIVDDITDDDDGATVAQREHELQRWQELTRRALAGRMLAGEGHDIWPAFAETVRRYEIPGEIFDEVIAGQTQDLRPIRFRDFDQLYEYCYRVAGVVGLASIRVWGYRGGEQTERLAIARGVAFQLTNILRDLREDGARGRVYLAREDLDAARITPESLVGGVPDDKFEQLIFSQIARAESFYALSEGLEERIAADSRPTLIAMTEIYRGLLKKIANEPARVLRERVSLSMLSKLRIGWRAMRRLRSVPSNT
jgi:phytoene synthase